MDQIELEILCFLVHWWLGEAVQVQHAVIVGFPVRFYVGEFILGKVKIHTFKVLFLVYCIYVVSLLKPLQESQAVLINKPHPKDREGNM